MTRPATYAAVIVSVNCMAETVSVTEGDTHGPVGLLGALLILLTTVMVAVSLYPLVKDRLNGVYQA